MHTWLPSNLLIANMQMHPCRVFNWDLRHSHNDIYSGMASKTRNYHSTKHAMMANILEEGELFCRSLSSALRFYEALSLMF